MTTTAIGDIQLEKTDSRAVEGKLVMTIPDGSGKSHYIVDKSDPNQTNEARRVFNTLVKDAKFLALSGEGSAATKINEFDPDAEAIELRSQSAGG